MGFITATECAERLGITTQTVRNRIAAGTLKGKKMGNTMMVDDKYIPPIETVTPPTSPVQAVNPNVLAPEVLRVIARYNDTGEMTANEIVLNMETQMRELEALFATMPVLKGDEADEED